MAVNVTEIYNTTWEHYQKAQESIIAKRSILEHSAAISDVIPGFEADKLEFGSYDKKTMQCYLLICVILPLEHKERAHREPF